MPQNSTWETVVRVVYPIIDAEQTLPLYVIDWTPQHLSKTLLDNRIDMRSLDFSHINQAQLQRLITEASAIGTGLVGTSSFKVESRSRITILKGCHSSFCTFFNAFPAAYWRRWTDVNEVRFQATVTGTGSIRLFRSNGRGLSYPAGVLDVDASTDTVIRAKIPMIDLMDGGYFWFDAEASSGSALTIGDACWQVPIAHKVAASLTSLSIAITTFDRPTYCMQQLKAISRAAELRMRLDTIYCVDQGNSLVSDQPEFEGVQSELGKQLTYLTQINIGGSGGFSRGMYETVKAGSSEYCLLLDDDAVSEPEAILRAIQFADYSKRPTLVGGGMLHLDNRTVLYSQGERVNTHRMWMEPSKGIDYNHDFGTNPLRDSPERHLRIDEDFNGWWMCLIPCSVIREIGLSMPFFIKFDDIEYGMRAKRAGYSTVCLPGVAVWHQAWHTKDDTRTWSEYFTHRNRWITALLASRKKNARMVLESLYSDTSLGLRFIYSAMELHHEALRDVLKGPDYIISSLQKKLKEVNDLRGSFTDAQIKPSLDDFPEPAHDYISPQYNPKTSRERRNSCIRQIITSLRPGKNARTADRPDVAITAEDTAWTWDAFAGIDSALVTTPNGNAVAWFKRENDVFIKSLWEGYRLARAIDKNWSSLSEAYRKANLASLQSWEIIFRDVND